MAEYHVGYLIKQVYLLNRARLNRIFSQFDLTASQTYALIFLFQAHDAGKEVNQKDMEEAMDISNPTVTGILNRLESKGLIQRVVCTSDARKKNIHITKKALELNKQLKGKFHENDEKLISCLSEEEAENFAQYLHKILLSNTESERSEAS